ncbi:MAG: ABC transporter substrate-binding protein [Clostridia bacterium]|nr:ABC transporter substrate-binding protein [Clostridia bacterium]
MKKLLTLICVVALTLCSCLTFVACNNNNSNVSSGKIRINEVTHSVFYAPLYVAINKGFLKENGIEVELVNGGGSDASMTALLSGSADIALMGPETVVYVEASGSTDHPVVFGQLTKKDGSFLISKSNITNFDFSNDLKNKTAIIGRRGGLPAMTFEWVCNNHGLKNGTNITLDTDTAFNMMVPVFESTDAEFCTMFEPTASAFVNNKKGYNLISVGELSGEIPYTCFMAYPKFLNQNKELATNFLSAIQKAYRFIISNSAEEVASALMPSFDGTSKQDLAVAVQKYLEIDAWSSTPVMSKDSFNRLLSVLKNAGTIEKDIDFSKVVDNTIANTI